MNREVHAGFCEELGVRIPRVAEHSGAQWAVACYFPRGQQTLKSTRNKIREDSEKAFARGYSAMAFVTNQEISISKRRELKSALACAETEIFHLERIVSILDSPAAYGVRLQYLGIEMGKEEQAAFVQALEDKKTSDVISALADQNKWLVDILTGGDSLPHAIFQPIQLGRDPAILPMEFTVLGRNPLFDVDVQSFVCTPGKGGGAGSSGPESLPTLYPQRRQPLWQKVGGRKNLTIHNELDSIVDTLFWSRNGRFVQRTEFQMMDLGPARSNMYASKYDSFFRVDESFTYMSGDIDGELVAAYEIERDSNWGVEWIKRKGTHT